MIRTNPSKRVIPLPVTLSSYPSCEGCLAWSNDGLAVACGENVHMLTFTNSVSRPANGTSPQPTVHTIRANLFDAKEWPQKDLTSCTDLSLGEEQSDSIVVGLAWSSPGLGVHRRSVLAVLTSNLKLSLWETDGTPGRWQRTCILNHSVQGNASAGNKRQRIRCFSWTPTLQTVKNDRWGIHHLAIADDSNKLHLYRISKHDRSAIGSWNIAEVWQQELVLESISEEQLSGLQCVLGEGRAIERLTIGDWNRSQDDLAWNTTFTYKGFHSTTSHELLVRVEAIDVGNEQRTFTHPELLNSILQLPTRGTQVQVKGPGEMCTLEMLPSWKKSLRDTCQKYDHQHNLNGRYRIRCWGFASHRDLEAICFTLHPSNMYEYTTTVMEKCKVVFQATDLPRNTALAPHSPTPIAIREAIIQFGLSLSIDENMVNTNLDEKVVKNFRHIGKFLSESCRGSTETREMIAQPSSKPMLDSSTDTCEICQAELPLTTDFTSAQCTRGHIHPRCSLSTVAIQEPGISKYCSACDREYLDYSKLNLPQSPNLTSTLFDVFDVCPFCQGKYRS